ncbi:hypothetical protein CPB83DRAFT_897568 [Crepidotus variabilis]|uniref:Uncharacterized protein n=1 Tax=Crepidotus variabilis TaxID=179855 RepID=A0A9P6E907_9AGAR|nr:hypothetical protein CPB83DRAFT_897568 [Crepidotus variabilis]
MNFFKLALALFVPALANALTINTPVNVKSCQPVQLSWTGGVPDYTLSAATFDWLASAPAGSIVSFAVSDSTGAVANSAPVTVDGDNTTCLQE